MFMWEQLPKKKKKTGFHSCCLPSGDGEDDHHCIILHCYVWMQLIYTYVSAYEFFCSLKNLFFWSKVSPVSAADPPQTALQISQNSVLSQWLLPCSLDSFFIMILMYFQWYSGHGILLTLMLSTAVSRGGTRLWVLAALRRRLSELSPQGHFTGIWNFWNS